MHSIKHKYNWPISVQWIRPIMSPTVTISRKTWSDVLPYVCSQILSTSYVCNGTISARNDVITPRALTIHVCRPHFVMNFKPIYLRLNFLQFQKGRHPRIQLTEIFKIRCVDLKSEKLHKKGRTLPSESSWPLCGLENPSSHFYLLLTLAHLIKNITYNCICFKLS